MSIKLSSSNHNCNTSGNKCTVVSMHLRMGDYDNHLKLTGLGPSFTKTDYIKNAVGHVMKKHQVNILVIQDIPYILII